MEWPGETQVMALTLMAVGMGAEAYWLLLRAFEATRL